MVRWGRSSARIGSQAGPLRWLALSIAISISAVGRAQEPAAPRPAAPALPEAEYPAQRLVSPHSLPELPSPDEYRHDGFFMRLGFGITYATGEVTTAPQDDPVGLGYEMLFGGTPWAGAVLGGGFIGSGLDASFPLASYAVFFQYYPDPKAGFHAQALGAFSVMAAEGRRFGPTAAVGAGNDWWLGRQTSIGAFVRVGYSTLLATSEERRAQSVFVMADGTFTWH